MITDVTSRGGRVQKGGTLLASWGLWGSAVSSPIGVWGGAPEDNAFFKLNTLHNISTLLLDLNFFTNNNLTIYLRFNNCSSNKDA